MQLGNLPTRITQAIANAASSAYRRTPPNDSQIGVSDGAASFHDGFPPLNAQPIGSGGVPPDIRDMNGFLFAVSAWSMWQAAGSPVPFDANFASAVGGYPMGARLISTANPAITWVSTADSNSTNPDSSSAANWVVEGDLGHGYTGSNRYFTVGQIIVNLGSIALGDNTGRVAVTFAKPFTKYVLGYFASNDSGGGNPSSWSGAGNATLTGMTVGMSIPNGPGQSGIPALAGTASTYLAIGV